MKNKKYLIVASMMIALIAVSMVSAFGVSSPYWEGNPLSMPKGSVKTVNLNLQNMVGNEDVTVEAKLVEGSGITSLDETRFTVPAQTSDIMVPLEISMPEDAATGDIKTVKIEFKTVSSDEGGIAMGTGMTILFEVVASEEVAEDNTAMVVTIVIAIAVLLAILWFLSRKKKR